MGVFDDDEAQGKKHGNHEARPPWCALISSGGGNYYLPSQINAYWSNRIQEEKLIFRRAAGVGDVRKAGKRSAHMSSPWVRVQVGEQISKTEGSPADKTEPRFVSPAHLLQHRKVPVAKTRVDTEEVLAARMISLERRNPSRQRQETPQPLFRASGKTIRESIGPLVVHQFGPIVPMDEGIQIG
jgi:hypothetical protein